MATLANLVVRLSADTAALERGLKGAKGHTDKFASVLKAGAMAGGAALAGLGVASLKMGIDFEKSMAEVKTLMPDISEKAFGKMRDDVLNLSKEMGIATNQAVPALYQAISAGIPRENVMEFMDVASKAAVGGVTDLETAVDGLSTVVNAFGLEASEAGRVADVMFTGVKLGKTTMEELSRSMFQAAPLAASLGLSIEDVVAATATLTKSGTPTAQAMTQIRQAMVALSKPNADMIALLEKTAYTSGEALLQAEGLASGLDILTTAAGGNKEEMAKAFGSVEALQAVLGLTGEAAIGAAEDLDAVTSSVGAADTAFDTMAETTSYKLNKAINEIKVEMTRLGAQVLPILVKGFEGLRAKFGDLEPLIAEVARHTEILREGLSDLQNDASDLGKAFSGLQGDMKLWTDIAIALLKLGVMPLVKGFRTIIETVGIVAALFRGDWSDALDHFRNLALVPLKTAWWAVGDVVTQVIIGMGHIVESGLNAIIPMLQTFVGWINAAIGGVNKMSGWIPKLGDKLEIGLLPDIKEVNLHLEDLESWLKRGTGATEYMGEEIRRFGHEVDGADNAVGGLAPSLEGLENNLGGLGGAASGAAAAIEILTPEMVALNDQIIHEEAFLKSVGAALDFAEDQHETFTAGLEEAEAALRSAEDAMHGWEGAILEGTRAYSDMAFGISQDSDALQLKINKINLRILTEGLEEGEYASGRLIGSVKQLARELGLSIGTGKLKLEDIEEVLDAAGKQMDVLGLRSRNVRLQENLDLGPKQHELEKFFEDAEGYAEYTLPEIKAGYLAAKDNADKATAAVSYWNDQLLVNELHLGFIRGLLFNHEELLERIRTKYEEIGQAATDAWNAAGNVPMLESGAAAAGVESLQHGGYITSPGLVHVEAGERVVPAGGSSGGPPITVIFNEPPLGDERWAQQAAMRILPYIRQGLRHGG